MQIIYRETPDHPEITYPVYLCFAGHGVILELTPCDVNTFLKVAHIAVDGDEREEENEHQ
jgi:hypothetical protein